MREYLLYLPVCLVCIFCLGCESRHAIGTNEKLELKLLTQSEYSGILSIAFDSIVGEPDNWKEWKKLSKTDSLEVAVEVVKEPFNLTDYPRELIGGWMFTSTSEFQEVEFKKIIVNPIYGVPNVADNKIKVLSCFRYKPIYSETDMGNYYLQEETPICKVKFYPIALNELESRAILICRLRVTRDWGEGVAFFFKKVNKEWNIVARKQLWIN